MSHQLIVTPGIGRSWILKKVKTVIKTVLVNSDCANTAIPSDALIRMHDYSERIRASGAHSDTSTLNR